MYTIDNIYTYEYIVKKSKFIVILIPIDNVNKIDDTLSDIKKKYPKATHYCYAYKIKNYSKYSDDGEPNSTAGIPILNSINKKNIDNVLCIVIRYFGGIKLGASGLIRTYGKVVRDSIDNIILIPIIEYVSYKITFDYDKVNIIDNILNDYVIDKIFDEKITYNIKIPIDKDVLNILKNYNVEIKKLEIKE